MLADNIRSFVSPALYRNLIHSTPKGEIIQSKGKHILNSRFKEVLPDSNYKPPRHLLLVVDTSSGTVKIIAALENVFDILFA